MPSAPPSLATLLTRTFHPTRLRLTDVKAEHYERKVATVEAERDSWEKKYEEAMEKYKSAQDEMTKLAEEIGAL